MIGEIKHGRGFRGILHYALEKPGAELLGSVCGTPDELTRAFGMIRARNERVEKPVFHMSIAIHPEEYLTNEQWEEVAQEMMDRLGYRNNLWVVVRHEDEPQSHCHIIGSRIRSDNHRVVDDYREKVRAEWILRDLEIKYGLRRVRPSAQAWRRSTTHGEGARAQRTGTMGIKRLLQDRIDAARSGHPTLTTFLDRLERMGVGVKANIGKDHISGISFELKGIVRKGSQLGKSYTWKGLLKTVDYRPERDYLRLKNAKPSLKRDPHDLDSQADDFLFNTVIKPRAMRQRFPGYQPIQPRPSPWFLEIVNSLGHVARRIDHEPHDEPEEKEERRRGRGR